MKRISTLRRLRIRVREWLYRMAARIGLIRPFCWFCSCANCYTGLDDGEPRDWLLHAPCSDGSMICSICYWYDVCDTRDGQGYKGPCNDVHCEHRPVIVGPWTKKESNND